MSANCFNSSLRRAARRVIVRSGHFRCGPPRAFAIDHLVGQRTRISGLVRFVVQDLSATGHRPARFHRRSHRGTEEEGALATDLGLLWELARPNGGALSARHRWRERTLKPIAKRIGERRARYGYEAAVRGFESVVTGRSDDPRAMIELLTADIAAKVTAVRRA